MRTASSQKRGWVIGVIYTLSFAVYGVLLPFLPIVLHARGLSDPETAIALSAYGIAALCSPIAFAHLADRRVSFCRLMPLLMAASTATIPLFLAADSVVTGFAIVLAFHLFQLPVMSLLDSFTMDFIIRSGPDFPRRFQDYRVWGSIGFMLPAGGLLALSQWQEVRPVDLIVMAAVLGLLSAVGAWFLPGNEPVRDSRELPSTEALRAALRPPLREVFVATAIAGLGLAIFYITFPRFLQELGCSTVEIGLIINLGVLFEVMMMPFAGRMIAAYTVKMVILLGILSLPARLFVVTIWPGVTATVLTQWLHAPLIVGLFVAVPIFLQENAAPSFRHSIQSLNISLVLGLTRFVGPWLGAAAVGAGDSAMQGLIYSLLLAGCLGAAGAVVLMRTDETSAERAVAGAAE